MVDSPMMRRATSSLSISPSHTSHTDTSCAPSTAHDAADIPSDCDVAMRLCVGSHVVPTVRVDGKDFVKITSRARWLLNKLGVKALSPDLGTLVRLRKAVDDSKGSKRVKGAWLVDKRGCPLSSSIMVTIGDRQIEVCTHGGPPTIIASVDAVSWLIARLRSDLEDDRPAEAPILDPCVDVQNVCVADSASDDDALADHVDAGDADGQPIVTPADIEDLKLEGVQYYKSRWAFVVKDTLLPTTHRLPHEFRVRSCRRAKRGSASAPPSLADETEFQRRRAIHFRKTGEVTHNGRLVGSTSA